MNYNRRKFIQSTGALVLGGVALSGKAASLLSNMAAPACRRPAALYIFWRY
jgi:hypothetical protein